MGWSGIFSSTNQIIRSLGQDFKSLPCLLDSHWFIFDLLNRAFLFFFFLFFLFVCLVCSQSALRKALGLGAVKAFGSWKAHMRSHLRPGHLCCLLPLEPALYWAPSLGVRQDATFYPPKPRGPFG